MIQAHLHALHYIQDEKMCFRIAINGYGRIGRCVLRALYEKQYRGKLVIVAVNDIADPQTMTYLTKYDTTHGRFPGTVSRNGADMVVNGDSIHIFCEEDISRLPWKKMGIDAVLECSGVFSSRMEARKHIEAGAGKVVFSHPAENDIDAVVFGVNHGMLDRDHDVISNASCTSNCVVPILKTIDDAFGIDHGAVTTIHSAMNDQPVIDAYHHTDLRRTRCAGQSIIPVDTKLAKGIGRLLPHLEGRFQAIALRVPTINVSAMDICMTVNADVTVADVNTVLGNASQDALKGIMGYCEEPLASWDFNHDCRSSIIDGTQTSVSGKRFVKLLAWFDNEWGYANRMLDTTIALLEA